MEVEEDEVVSRNYTLERVPSYIEEQLKLYTDHRISPLNRMRLGSCVVALTVEHDKSTTLRFLGWLKREHDISPNLKSVFGASDLGERAEECLIELIE